MANTCRTATVHFSVPFAHVDAMHVWHAHYLEYFDRARDLLYFESELRLACEFEIRLFRDG